MNLKKVTFYKCNGNGNKFSIILIDDSSKKVLLSKSNIIKICNLDKKNVSDGLIILEIDRNKIFMDYYNNDGSWETFCLNGLRCAALLLNKKLSKKIIKINCNKIVYETEILNDYKIKVNLPEPKYVFKNIKVNDFKGEHINSGAKHFVIEYNNLWLSNEELTQISREIRYNDILFPDGINVNYYKYIDSRIIEVKTYEKGIESMMKSCASGSYACAYNFCKKNNINNETIKILNEGGQLEVFFSSDYSRNFLIGKSKIEYTDTIDI